MRIKLATRFSFQNSTQKTMYGQGFTSDPKYGKLNNIEYS